MKIKFSNIEMPIKFIERAFLANNLAKIYAITSVKALNTDGVIPINKKYKKATVAKAIKNGL